jgi:phospholipase/carboxylesterase
VLVRERPADGQAAGALVLLHGRGADEHDLFPVLDLLDPDRRLDGYTPRAPLTLPPGGAHWYIVPRVGYPDPDTFHAAYRQLAALHDRTRERLGVTAAQTILGGFSMGAVMSYALGLGADRPAPAGILAFSGFVPVVEGWQPQLPRPTKTFIAHGRRDPIMQLEFARRARHLLQDNQMDVDYHEGDSGHWVEPAHLAEAKRWVADTLALMPSPADT